jgi:heat shock protein HslJ
MTARLPRMILLVALAMLPTCVGCAPRMPGAPVTPDLQPPLEDTSWILESMGQPGNLHPVLDGTEVTLALSDDSDATGTAGCNGYGGSYTSDRDGTLSFKDLFHTEMYCMQPGVMDQEQEFLDALAAAENYEIVEGTLRISGDGVMVVMAAA